MDVVTFACSLPRGDDEVEIEVQVQGTYFPARGATGNHLIGWDPPEPATFEVDEVRVNGKVATEALEQEIEAALRQTIGAVCLERIADAD